MGATRPRRQHRPTRNSLVDDPAALAAVIRHEPLDDGAVDDSADRWWTFTAALKPGDVIREDGGAMYVYELDGDGCLQVAIYDLGPA